MRSISSFFPSAKTKKDIDDVIYLIQKSIPYKEAYKLSDLGLHVFMLPKDYHTTTTLR